MCTVVHMKVTKLKTKSKYKSVHGNSWKCKQEINWGVPFDIEHIRIFYLF